MTMFTSTLSGPTFRLPRVSLPLGQWIRVFNERRALGSLSEHHLSDIGVDATTAASEASRPFWALPEGR